MVTRRGLAGIAAALALWGASASAQGTLKIGATNPPTILQNYPLTCP